MEKGGIVTDEIVSTWVSDNEFEKKDLKRIVYHNAKDIGESRVILGQTKFPSAYTTEHCISVECSRERKNRTLKGENRTFRMENRTLRF